VEKIKIVHNGPVSSFNSAWLVSIFDQYLEFVPWDSTATYAPGTLFYINVLAATKESIAKIHDHGFKIVIDNLWEVDPGPMPGTKRLCCPAWFWYNESLWYQYLGYDQYVPKKDIKYVALMPMNKRKPHRDNFLKTIQPLLDRMLWSYVEQGRQLPNDRNMSDWNTQRYLNPEWYNQCYMSMVVETFDRPSSKYTPTLITEKTFKPIAMQHPFMVYGNRNTLTVLKSWGFETFNNLWSEDYDTTQDTLQRKLQVFDELSKIVPDQYDKETLARLQHNHQLFYNTNLVKQRIVKEIVYPIIEYAETQ
jgi:hypothetical protein